MASVKGLFLFLFAAAAVATNMIVVRALDFEVGDKDGWQTPKNNREYFERWAKLRGPFIVGDKLHFRYNNESDTVLLVDKEGYYHCHYDVVHGYYNDGNTIIKLVNRDTYYFVSNVSNHCVKGLRLLVNVVASRPQPSPPTATVHQPPPSPASNATAPAPAPASSAVSNLATSPILLVALTAAFISFMAHALPFRL